MNEDEKIFEELHELEAEHRTLDDDIDARVKAGENLMMIQRMKKRKLWLKDRISHLHSLLHPDIIA